MHILHITYRMEDVCTEYLVDGELIALAVSTPPRSVHPLFPPASPADHARRTDGADS